MRIFFDFRNSKLSEIDGYLYLCLEEVNHYMRQLEEGMNEIRKRTNKPIKKTAFKYTKRIKGKHRNRG